MAVPHSAHAWANGEVITSTLLNALENDLTQAGTAFAPLGDGRSFGLYRPENYGAVGDGTTDDTTAMQAWLNALVSNKVRGEMRGVTYKVSAALTCNSDAIRIQGAGSGATIISSTGNTYDLLTLGTGNGAQVTPTGYIRGIAVTGPTAAPTSGKAALKINGLNQFVVEDVRTDNQDIGFDLVNNCYGAEFLNIRGGFGGTLNVGVNLRTGADSGSDLTFINPWVNGKIAGFSCSGGGGGYHVFGGQVSAGQGTSGVTDTSGAFLLGKDYLTGNTGGTTIDLHGCSFEGTNYAWAIRSFDEVHVVLVGCSVNPADSTKPAIGIWKADNLKNGHAEFHSTGLSGYFSGANLLVVQNNYYTRHFLMEVGTFCSSDTPTINGTKGYVESITRQSGLLGNAIVLGLGALYLGGIALLNSGGLQQSTDYTNYFNLAQTNDTRFTAIPANTQTASYTAALTDAGRVIEMNAASANTFTVPPNSSVAFPTNTVLEVHQYGAGQTTITAGSGVTIRTSASLTTRAQYSTVALRKRGTDEWVLSGDLT